MAWFKENFNKKIRQRIYFLIIILVFFSIFFYKIFHNRSILKAGDCIFTIEIADTLESQYQGLSNREDLCEKCAMLFLFPEKKDLKFVMRDMNFPLDIIFIANREIINFYENAEPEDSDPKLIYSSLQKADAVLEINAGMIKKCNINNSDIISWSN